MEIDIRNIAEYVEENIKENIKENNIIVNNTDKNVVYNLKNFTLKSEKNVSIKFDCNQIAGYSYINVNNIADLPAKSEAILSVMLEQDFSIKLIIGPHSRLEFKKIEIIHSDTEFLNITKRKKMLVIVSDYTTDYCNVSEFIHKLNKQYVSNGIEIQVASINNNKNWYDLKYCIDGIEVIKGNYTTLKNLLIYEDYKLLLVYSINEELLQILEGHTNPEQQLVFKIENNELLECFNMSNYNKPYFTGDLTENYFWAEEKHKEIDFFAKKENVTWIFKSQRIYDFYKDKFDFKNSYVMQDLPKYINENKTAKSKNKYHISIIKNFDNYAINKVDECVLTILELSKRAKLKNLIFDIYGDGAYFDELIEPIKTLKNVEFHKNKMIDKNEILKNSFIYLNPCKYDMTDFEIYTALNNNCYVVTTPANISYNQSSNFIYEAETFMDMSNIIEKLVEENTIANFENDSLYESSANQEIELIKKLLKKDYKEINYKKSANPVLTIAIPSYNVEKYLTKCLSSLIYQRNINKLEILVINDGSKDKTRDIALKFQKKTRDIVHLIDKENGGHGSAVNLGMKLAKGKYFKILDSDDWIKGEELANLIDYMEKSDSDLILTNVCKEYVPVGILEKIISYEKLHAGIVYHFDDLLLDTYGFYTNPLFAACNYKTKTLRNANFEITEKKLYADHEFDAFSLKCIDTVEYYPLNIYMYLIGREGQSVSLEIWRKKYKDHQNALFTMLSKLEKDIEFKETRKEYVYRVNAMAMVLHQLNTMLGLDEIKGIEKFIKKLSQYESYDIIKYYLLQQPLCPLVKDIVVRKKFRRFRKFIKGSLPYFIVEKLKKKGVIL